MYRLAIYDGIGSDVRTVLFAPGELSLERWGKRINAASPLTFSIHRFAAKATEDNLRPYRRVRLYRRPRAGGSYVAEWFGYIEAVKEVDDRLEVICAGMLDLFRKRYTADPETLTGQGSVEAFGLLTDTNGDSDTGIVTGVGGVTTTRNLEFKAADLFSAWERCALAYGAEFEIDADGAFNFVPELGSDKSGSIELIFRRDGQPGSDVDEVETGREGKPMANRVIGISSASGGITSTQNDATSQSSYGLLVERKQFSEATNQGTLDAMTSAYLEQRANPISDFRVRPTLATKRFNPTTGNRQIEGIDIGEINPGDLVTVTIHTENMSTSTAKRVVEKIVTVDDRLAETLHLTLSEAGIRVSSAMLDALESQDIRRRLREVEALL